MLENLDTVIAFSLVMLLLSLLVTTLVQMVAAALGLRGKVLLNGTERLLKQLYPDLENRAREIARKVLTHPAVSPEIAAFGRKPKLSVAIRPQELILILQDLAAHDADLAAVRNDLQQLFTQAPGQGSPEMVAKGEELLQKLEQQFPQQAADLRGTVEGVLGTTQSIVVKVDAWFDTVMDRTSGVFTTYTRRITVAVAILTGLLLHVDSLAILNQLSQDKDLRARLVQMSSAVQQEGEKVLASEGYAPAAETIEKLGKDETQPDLAKAIAAGCPGGDLAQCTAGLKTREDGEGWLNHHLPQDQRQKAVAAYAGKFTEVTQAHLKDLGDSFKQLQNHLAQTQLKIVPSPIPWFWEFTDRRNFLGVVMTIFFLSLGAPFWYNALRRLSDLRPIVARRVDGGPAQGAPKQGS